MRAIYLHSGDNSRDNRHYYSHAIQNLLLKWMLTRIRATIIPAIISGIIAEIIAGIIVLLRASGQVQPETDHVIRMFVRFTVSKKLINIKL